MNTACVRLPRVFSSFSRISQKDTSQYVKTYIYTKQREKIFYPSARLFSSSSLKTPYENGVYFPAESDNYTPAGTPQFKQFTSTPHPLNKFLKLGTGIVLGGGFLYGLSNFNISIQNHGSSFGIRDKVAECSTGHKYTNSSPTEKENVLKGDYKDAQARTFHPMWRSEAHHPLERKFDDALIFCGTSNRPLSEQVADRLGMRLGTVTVKRYADGEVNIRFLDSMRGKDVYLIQPTSPPVNDNLLELLLMISTCRRSSAKKITAIIPYYGYARQDRKLSSRVPISAADVACMIQAMGVDRVVAIDLHCGQIQGFFGPRVPVDNLEAQIIGLDYFDADNLVKPIVISPDAGGVYRAGKFQEGLISRGHTDCGIAMIIKQRIRENEINRMELVGNVDGSDVIIVDDMIDTAKTLCEAAHVLRKQGARRVFAFATHGLFSGEAIDRIEKSPLEKVVVTDSIKPIPAVAQSSKIGILSVSVLIADAIRRIHQKESLNDLFKMGVTEQPKT
ncbi:phosphoribosylpyrophosphate synthetase [Cardiosporidium cionae]|uniref:ribose-phosphate diphosphokinase n=1 Tax=Cardiosporidium cionae TaxID=476202 RepID=A0ABQ7JDG6_9APIC|nr:phosphoribosylpyrophosphate synthetase [Cardiosporidium cionae]|eukprot:KAF8822043.1 phosphoribosylpyrophosphate synthetase [Cardiosporidium cionae]